MTTSHPSRLVRLQARLAEGLALAGVAVIGALVVCVVTDVVLRSVWNAPLKGTVDYVSTGIGAAIALVMPYGFLADKHISVPIATDLLPGGPRWLVASAGALVSAGFFSLLTWQTFVYAAERLQGGDRMMIVGWSTWPVWYAIAVLFAVAALATWTLAAITLLAGPERGARPGRAARDGR